MLRKNRSLVERIGIAVALFLAACALHFVWNSPWLVELVRGLSVTDLLPYLIIKGLPALVLLSMLDGFARRREVVWFDDALRTEGALVPPDDLAVVIACTADPGAPDVEMYVPMFERPAPRWTPPPRWPS